MSEHGWTRHGHRCCDQATGPRPGRVARCGGPAICRECAADAAIRHSPGSGTFAAPSAPSEPVQDQPRVWELPTIPEDVKALRDGEGRVWRREPKGWRRDTTAWTEKDPLLLLAYHPRLSPLAEVVDPDGD